MPDDCLSSGNCLNYDLHDDYDTNVMVAASNHLQLIVTTHVPDKRPWQMHLPTTYTTELAG